MDTSNPETDEPMERCVILMEELQKAVHCCYTTPDKHLLVEPYCFKCGHSYCKKCLLQIYKNNYYGKGYRCQECSAVMYNVREMQPSTFMALLVDKYKHFVKLPKCSTCKSAVAIFTCRQCTRKNLCKPCAEKHKSQTLLRSKSSEFHKHDKLKLKDFAVEKLTELSCSKHQQELRYHCTTCKELICVKCKNSSHADHELRWLNAALQDAKKEITDYLSSLDKREEMFLLNIKTVQDYEEKFQRSYHETMQALKEKRKSLGSKAKAGYRQLKQYAEEMHKDMTDQYKDMISEQTNKYRELRQRMKWARMVQALSDSECLLQTYQEELQHMILDFMNPTMWQGSGGVRLLPFVQEAQPLTEFKLVGSTNGETGETCLGEIHIYTYPRLVKDEELVSNIYKNKFKFEDFNEKSKKECVPLGITECMPEFLGSQGDKMYLLDTMETETVSIRLLEDGSRQRPLADVHIVKALRPLTESYLVITALDGLRIVSNTFNSQFLLTLAHLHTGRFGAGLWVEQGEITALLLDATQRVVFFTPTQPGKCTTYRRSYLHIDTGPEFEHMSTVIKHGEKLLIAYPIYHKIIVFNSTTAEQIQIIGPEVGLSRPKLVGLDCEDSVMVVGRTGDKVAHVINKEMQAKKFDFSQLPGLNLMDMHVAWEALWIITEEMTNVYFLRRWYREGVLEVLEV